MGLPLAKQSGGLFSVRAAQGANPATPAQKPVFVYFLAEIHEKQVFFYVKNAEFACKLACERRNVFTKFCRSVYIG